MVNLAREKLHKTLSSTRRGSNSIEFVRQARQYDSVDGESPAVNATTTTTETTASPSVNIDENATENFYPKYFFIGWSVRERFIRGTV